MHIAFKVQVIRMCLARGKIFENCGFFKETRQNLPFIEKYATNKFTFGIIHVKCYVRMYLVYVFFRKDSMKVNMDKIRQYEGSRKKYNPNT